MKMGNKNLRNLLVPRAGIEPARLAAGDFESPASTYFTTEAFAVLLNSMKLLYTFFHPFVNTLMNLSTIFYFDYYHYKY
jgi:hypothetical protein